jgi:hypothetical protein
MCCTSSAVGGARVSDASGHLLNPHHTFLATIVARVRDGLLSSSRHSPLLPNHPPLLHNRSNQQLHLVDAAPGEAPQVVNGAVGLAVPSLEAVAARLATLESTKVLDGTQFRVIESKGADGLAVRCPFGNLFIVHECGLRRGAASDPGEDKTLSHFERLRESRRH